MTDRNTSRSRGFGFVVLDDENVVEYILTFQPHSLGGKDIDIKMAVPAAQK